MRVLLTGGAGFIGSALARAILAEGWELRVLDALTYAGRREHLAGLDLDFHEGDVCDGAAVERALAGVDGVVHAAAESHVGRALQDPAPFFRTNIEGTRVLLEACARARIPHAIHVSTDEVFGSAPEGVAFAPEDALRPGNMYAASKAGAEAVVHALAHTAGYATTIVRCTNNYGPRQHEEKAIPGWIAAGAAGQDLPVHGQGSAIRDWLHVDDFAAGITALLKRAAPGEVHHFSGGNALPNREVAGRIARFFGVGLAFGPERPGQDARYALDDRATRDALGWAPRRSFDAGLTELLEEARRCA